MTTYYNERDPFAARWLRNLIAAGLIAPGHVDDRSIEEVRPDDLAGFTQCHFFAGIAGWSLALRLAGWPDDRPVWTGSCPCQPFSAAGKGKAADDERHLWPCWFSLIRECKPPIVFGEQVEAAIGWGWLDLVFSDLEAEGYACGAAVLPACSVGAPHIRQRLWFVADAHGRYAGPEGLQRSGQHGLGTQDGGAGFLAQSHQGQRRRLPDGRGSERDGQTARWIEGDREPQSGGLAGELGDASRDEQRQPRLSEAGERRAGAAGRSGAWSNLQWLPCTDGKARPTKSGIFPLAHGIPGRVGQLRAAGNAITPQIAAEFIQAAAE